MSSYVLIYAYMSTKFSFTERYVAPIPHRLWNHDYAPHGLTEFVGNQMVVETIQSFLKSQHLPNIMLCGPHGCGKTTLAQLLVKEYLGVDDDRFHLKIIGSIYRGKNVVSEKTDKKKTSDMCVDNPNIIHFIRKTANLPNHKCRVVTIYDFECMTTEAQMALRRIIEIYSHKVRFIFLCNNLNKIIEAIQSRTLILKCQPITLEEIVTRLKTIATDQQININEEVFQTIGMMAQGDLKQAINYLQVFAHSPSKQMENFYHLFNIPSIQRMSELIQHCLQGQGTLALIILDQLLDNGYNVTDILDILIKVLLYRKDLSETDRVFLIEETIKVICINEQTSSPVHLYRLVVSFLKKSIPTPS